MFLHFGYFLRKGVFLQKGFLSAEILSFCRNTTVFLQKAFGPNISAETNLSAETYLFLQKQTSFCRKQPLSAERHVFLSLTAFGRNFLLSVLSLYVSAVTVSVDL